MFRDISNPILVLIKKEVASCLIPFNLRLREMLK